MTRPTVSQAEQWQPQALDLLGDAWERAADLLRNHLEDITAETAGQLWDWAGTAAERAGASLDDALQSGVRHTRALTAAAVAAHGGASRLGMARSDALAAVATAKSLGFQVSDAGIATPTGFVPESVRNITGNDPELIARVLADEAERLSAEIGLRLDALGSADDDAALDITEAMALADDVPPPTAGAGGWPIEVADLVAGWPSMSQDRISAQIAALDADQRRVLIDAAPREVGNTDGVPWDMRIAANRINIADAILAEQQALENPQPGADPELTDAAQRRIDFYRGLLADVDDPTGRRAHPVNRQILAFDPDRQSLIELQGDLADATSVAVFIPGLNTTMLDSAPNTETARRFVAAGQGKVAMITYLGGPFPTGDNVVEGIWEAAKPEYALDMAPRLVAFSEDVNRTVDASGRHIPVTYVGHSYGGSILGTAEHFGLTADRTMYVAAAGAGVNVFSVDDWHNRNPEVSRYAMTAPGDWIQMVQGGVNVTGVPLAPHGVDVDGLPIVHLDAGDRLDGTPMSGWDSHGDVVNEPSDAWKNILGVITGDPSLLRVKP